MVNAVVQTTITVGTTVFFCRDIIILSLHIEEANLVAFGEHCTCNIAAIGQVCFRILTIEWQQEIKAGSFCLDTVKINCMCNYGATMASALQITRSVEVPLNNLFTIAVKTILLPFFLKDDEGYIITVQLVVNINEDGGGFIVGMMSADGGDRTFQIDL